MLRKKLTTLFFLTIILSGIVTIFWYQEMRYMLPTPVPEAYTAVEAGNKIETFSLIDTGNSKPAVLHFFNPDCPCSKFNIAHFRSLVKQYRDKVAFYAVLQTEDESGAAERFEQKYNLDIPVIIDTHKKLAIACGVYSTPQAVIIDKNGILYYRGNYNKARYCTNKNSNFAQMALDSLLAEKKTPVFIESATLSYGCELPDGPLEANVSNY